MKKILIDTHILIWWLADPTKIRKEHLNLVSNQDNIIFVSIASFFEITIKVKQGKLEFNGDFREILSKNGFEALPLSLKHIEEMSLIEFKNKDPFDMAIISQAISENLDIISYDSKFENINRLKLL